MRTRVVFKNLTVRTGVLALCLSAGAFAQAQTSSPEWGYQKGPQDPAHWGELDPAFEACGQGQAQSPVNIQGAHREDLPALSFDYPVVAPSVVSNGHSVQVNLPAGAATLKIGDREMQLLQFHFHSPSENEIHGKRAAMEVHFVHKDADGKLGVLAILIHEGKHDNPAYAPVFGLLHKLKLNEPVDVAALDLSKLLPHDKGYYEFKGSLTTPPCSEGVTWMVLREPIELGVRQVEAFRQFYPHDARPVQPLNGREIEESR
jgi:carbonic anhydrase